MDDLLYWTNFRLGTNQHMTYPIGNSTPVIERKYRFILNGVFFHKDNTHYWHGSYPHLVYSENLGEAINVFFQSDGTTNSHGWANMSGDRFVEFSDTKLYVHDLSGVEVLVKELSGIGNLNITIDGSTLHKGMYIYSLTVEGEFVDSKRMILTD